MRAAWKLSHHSGAAAELLGLDIDPTVPSIMVLEVTSPALVLGSTQPDAVVDWVAASATGTEVARRGSGGGAVLLRPSAQLWVDVVLPRTDALWHDDVHRSFGWLGAAWSDALSRFGVEGHVHEGPPLSGRAARLACFAGVSAGEVHAHPGSLRKYVGLSQRRGRAGARFQCACYFESPGDLPLAGLDRQGRQAAEPVLVPSGSEQLIEALLAALP